MNLKKNRGAATLDVSIAVIILLATIPVMFGVAYNFLKDNNYARRQGKAVQIATDVIEIAKSTEFEGLTLEEESEFIRKFKRKI